MSRMPRWAAVALILAFTLQVLPQQLDLGASPVSDATAPQPQPYLPAQHFGQAGPRTWHSYMVIDPANGNQFLGMEPSIGVAWNIGDGKTAMYQTVDDRTPRLTWDDRVTYPAAPPMTVYDASPNTYVGGLIIPNPANGPAARPPCGVVICNTDPILYTDYDNGRTFAGGMWIDPNPALTGLDPVVGCSMVSYTDDNGGNWVPMMEACSNPLTWDHPSIGSGPWALPKPPQATYDRGVYYCSQGVGRMNCAVSYDGGLSFVQAGPQIMTNGCGGLHGHIRVSRIDGTVYVPNKRCGTQTAIVVSEDNGLTWINRPVPGTVPSGLGLTDPSVGISEQSGWIYVGQTEEDSGLPPAYAENGGAWISLSKNKGLTWEPIGESHLNLQVARPGQCFSGARPGTALFERFNVGCLVPNLRRAVFADVIAGDDDRVAFAFLGSDVNFCTSNQPTVPGCAGNCASGIGNTHEWHLYVAMTYDAGKTWQVDKLTSDPVQRGYVWTLGGSMPCRNMLDFQDMAIDREGRPVISWTDGCVACGSYTTSTGTGAMVSRLSYGRGLHAAMDCSWICDMTNQPLGGVPDPEAGQCSGKQKPEVKWVEPHNGQLITSPQTEFHGTVDLLSENASLTAEAYGIYAGYVNEDIPIVGTADCTAEEDVFDCRWSSVPAAAAVQFNPTPSSCVTNVRYPHQGVYTLLLTVTDPLTSRVATDLATVFVRARDPGPPRCGSGTGAVPLQTQGIIIDNDPDTDHATAPGAPPAPTWLGGTNEITCFGAYYNTATDMVELHLYVRDALVPVDATATPPGSSETYWFSFTPSFGDLKDQPQVIEVWWDNTGPYACWLNGPPEATAGPIEDLTGLDPRVRHTEQPNAACDLTGLGGLARYVGASWNVNDLVVEFPVISLNPVTQDNSAKIGDELRRLHAHAWHVPGAGDWNSAGSGPSLCIAGCTGVFSDDDFSPDCKSATLRFVAPNKLGLAGSCNPATPTSLSSGGGGSAIPTPKKVADAVQGALAISLGPLGLPPLPDAGAVIADVKAAADGAVGSVADLAGGLGLPVDRDGGVSIPSPDVPDVPTGAPGAPGGPGPGAPAPGTPLPAGPVVPAVPGLPPGGPSMTAPPCCVPPPTVPPGVEEYVIVSSGWASAYVPVSTSSESPHDTWLTPLGQGLTMGMNGDTTLRVDWFKGDGVNVPVLLDTDIITVWIDIAGRTDPGVDVPSRPGPADGSSGADLDRDGVPDNLDNCSTQPNPDQGDANQDGTGDACQEDADSDGIPNARDTCPLESDPGQRDADGDATGDACDEDVDGDGVANAADNCVWVPNKDQKVSVLGAPRGDACNPDIDGDGVENLVDLCPDDPACALSLAKGEAQLATGKSRAPLGAQAPAEAPQSFSTATWPAAIGAAALLALIGVLLVARRRQA